MSSFIAMWKYLLCSLDMLEQEHILNNIIPIKDDILLQYMSTYKRQFGLLLRDNFPTNLQLAQNQAKKIEENMFFTNIDPFGTSRGSNFK